MARIAGIYYFDGGPISPDDESWVRMALASKPERHAGFHRAPGVLMGVASTREQVPGGVAQRAGICTWDGRLDNSRDLCRSTEAGSLPADSGIALALYQFRGIPGLRDLIGDWSLAIWDASRRAIVL